jgi:hypothetical protein
MEEIRLFETSVYLYPSTLRHIREGVLHMRFMSVYLFLMRRSVRVSENTVRDKQFQVSKSLTYIRKLSTSNSDRDIRYIDWVLVLVLLSHCIQEPAGMAVGRITEIQRNLRKNRRRTLSAVFWCRGCQSILLNWSETSKRINEFLNKEWLDMNVGAAHVKMSRCTNKAYVRNRDSSLEHVTSQRVK